MPKQAEKKLFLITVLSTIREMSSQKNMLKSVCPLIYGQALPIVHNY